MTRLKIEQLVWDLWNTEHIKGHNVSKEEVEEAVQNILTHRMGHSKKIILIGRAGKRLIAMIMGHEKGNKYYPATARDADRKERKLVYEKEKQITKV